MALLRSSLAEKAEAFANSFKIGRTHLQDAVPMTLGQEFSGYAHQVLASTERVTAAMDGMYELPLGGTAVGTGLNAPEGFAGRTISRLAERSQLPFHEARNHFEAQGAKDAVLFLSGALKSYAVALTKIANDIRWLGSGAIRELRLKAMQPGSSIMPGKVNPVIAESVLMVCAQVIGHDAAITWACAGGNFELNTMMPVIAFDLLDSIALLSTSSRNLAELCVRDLVAEPASAGESGVAMATLLAPEIGYDLAAAIAKEAQETGRSVREVALGKSGLSADRLEALLHPSAV